MRISIIVPTYNEKENVKKIIPIIYQTLKEYDHEIIVVDDNSPDGTSKIAQELSKKYPVTVIKRPKKLGLSSAICHGFQNSERDILGVIDADLQHPPEYLKIFINNILDGYDIVIGSRYIKGGKTQEWGIFRSLVSKSAILLSRPLTNVRDPMSGYFMLKRSVIENISFNPIGYKILLEILVKGSYRNVKEIPFIFRCRGYGKSKLNREEYISYLKLLYHLYKFKIRK